jgi:hypothetical protein
MVIESSSSNADQPGFWHSNAAQHLGACLAASGDHDLASLHELMCARFMQWFSVLFIIGACLPLLPAQAEERVSVKLDGAPGPYTVERWKHDWPGCEWEDGISEGHASVVSRDEKEWLRVSYAIGRIGPEKGGVGWRWPIPSTGSGPSAARHESAELRYTVRFSKDFDWVKGGKLPGLCGGPENVSGGRPATGTNGFSARLMWRRDGRAEAYVYHVNANQRGDYGDSFTFPESFRFPTEKDVHVRVAVVMNTVGKRDGAVRVWIAVGEGAGARGKLREEQLMVERTDMEWRTINTFGVDSVYFESFHGGSDESWAPTRECWAEFGGIRVSAK